MAPAAILPHLFKQRQMQSPALKLPFPAAVLVAGHVPEQPSPDLNQTLS